MGFSKCLVFGVDSKYNKFYYIKMYVINFIILKCM